MSRFTTFGGRILAPCITLVSVVLVSACAIDLSTSPFADDIRENLLLSDAQQLVPFVICSPARLPNTVSAQPNIVYSADPLDPGMSSIRLRYNYAKTANVALDVKQDWTLSPYSVPPSKSAIYGLTEWIVLGWPVPNGEGVDENQEKMMASAQARMTVWSGNRSDGAGRNLHVYEVLTPPELHGSLVQWVHGQLQYSIYSRLPLTETTLIAFSLPNCGANPNPTVTPVGTWTAPKY